MEQELIQIFNEELEPIGIATREEVHRLGYWHETFQCWFLNNENGTDYLYLQIRSGNKKDFPGLLDITAAGHILAHETIEDGVRELHEELGVNIALERLLPLGKIENCIILGSFIDNEIANVFLYRTYNEIYEFCLQEEEVAGIVKVEYRSFCDLWLGNIQKVTIEGFEANESGEQIMIKRTVDKEDFVPHRQSYYEHLIMKISKHLC